jgi:isopentenyl phosphate kinase
MCAGLIYSNVKKSRTLRLGKEIMKELHVFVKLGGSILTDKTQPEAINRETLHSVARTLAETLAEDSSLRVLIGHGGGSFGHYWAQQYATHTGVYDARGWEGVSRVADAMGRLNRIVVGALLEAGINAVAVQPSASARAEGGILQSMDTHVIGGMLKAGLTPVVYGDVVLDSQQGAAIISTEGFFAYLAHHLQPKRIVLLGEAGVYTADPRRDPGAVRIAQITRENIMTVLEQTGASHGTDVTGGMAAKVRQMWQLVEAVPGVTVSLVGTDARVVRAALLGKPIDEGTVISDS